MNMVVITVISLSLSLLSGFIYASLVSGALGIIKDKITLFNKFVLLHVIIPTFLISTSLLSIIFHIQGLFNTLIHIFTIVYLIYFLNKFNLEIQKKKRLRMYEDVLLDEIINPWLETVNLKETHVSFNLYFIGKQITGNVSILCNGYSIDDEQVDILRNELRQKSIVLHVCDH
ncbi:hypothetical protein C4A75_04740 [Brevibacillus laterosporus]|uniref:hypothetical protein n=1 Tax=Brevibacillus laterosporus TaxID=1465 RepID=UPI000CE4FE2A|nr:hypothetical protein [Brevibacillus laterosporus]PPA86541.1 hypothetical protein C4A75_04740 [Brevibacillus laterosporus]